LVVLAGILPASAAPQAKPLALNLPKLDVSGSGVFAPAPAAGDLAAPASVPGAPVPSASQPIKAAGTRVFPDTSFTPGRLCTTSDPNFKEFRYGEHVPYCNRNVSQQMKQEVAAHYGVPKSDWPNYEFDHLIPLGIGGNSSIVNLWPQPRGKTDGSDDKDRLEDLLYHQMSSGSIKQAAAVEQIWAWFQGSSETDKGMLYLLAAGELHQD
jgi:hypothetical protein